MLNENTSSDLTNENVLNIEQIDTQNKTNQIMIIDNNGFVQWSPPTGLEIEVQQIQPSDIAYEVLTTNNSLEIEWNKLTGNSILENTISSGKIISLDFDKLTNLLLKITTGMLQNLSVTNEKINTMDFDKLTNTALKITNAMIQNLAVNNAKISDLDFDKLTNTLGKITNDMLANNSVSEQKIQNNSITSAKLFHPDSSNKILLTDGNTNPTWGFLQNANITDNTIGQEKIISLPTSKLTGQVINSQITDNNITAQKMNMPKNSRQLYVDFALGTDSADYGTILKPYRTLQYAINQVTVNGYIIIIQSNITENIVIDGKNQLVLKFQGSSVQNSPNLELTGKVTIQNSSSIKIVDCQVNATSLMNEHCLTISSGNNYFKNVTFVADSGHGCLINSSGASYNQFQNCDFALYFQNSAPSTNLTLVYSSSNITNNVSITQAYNLAIDNCAIQGITQNSGSLQIYNSQIQGDITYSASSPQICAIAGCRFLDATLTAKKILKSGTSFYIFDNNIYNTTTSSFVGTRLYQNLVLDTDLVANTISLNKLKNGTPSKTLIYNGSGILSETDFPSSVSDISQITNTTLKDGFYRLNSSSSATFQTTIGNSDFAAYSFDLAGKMQAYPDQLNKFLRIDNASGYLTFADQSTSTPFSQITDWPGNNTQVILGNGAYDKINFFNINSGNDYTILTPGKAFVWKGKNVDIGEIITQTQFATMDSILSGSEITDKIIPFSKLANSDTNSYGTAFYGLIAGSAQIFRLTNSLFNTLCNQLPIINYTEIISANSPSDGNILTYSLADAKFKWIANLSSQLQTQYINIGVSGEATQRKSDNASLYDDTFFEQPSGPQINNVLVTKQLNQTGWSKLNQNHLNTFNSASNNQFLQYSSTNGLQWASAGGVSLFSQFNFNSNITLNYERPVISYVDSYNDQCFRIKNTATSGAQLRYMDYFISSRAPVTGHAITPLNTFAFGIQGVNQGASGGPCGMALSYDQNIFYSPNNSPGEVARFCDSDTGSTTQFFTSYIRINTNATLSQVSDENMKKNIIQQTTSDEQAMYDLLQNMSVSKFMYNEYDKIIQQKKQEYSIEQDQEKKNQLADEISRLIFKSSKKYYGFMYQQFMNLNLSGICDQSFDHQYSQTEINKISQDCDDVIKNKIQERKQKIIEDETKTMSVQSLFTVLFSGFKHAQKKIEDQQTKIEQQQNQIDLILSRLQNAGL